MHITKKYNSILNLDLEEESLYYKSFYFFKKKYRSEFKGKQNKNLKFSETNKLNLNTNLTKKILNFNLKWNIKKSLRETLVGIKIF